MLNLSAAHQAVLAEATRVGCFLSLHQVPNPSEGLREHIAKLGGHGAKVHPRYVVDEQGRIQSDPLLTDLPWQCLHTESGREILDLDVYAVEPLIFARICGQHDLADALTAGRTVREVLADHLGLETSWERAATKLAFWSHLESFPVTDSGVKRMAVKLLERHPHLRGATERDRQLSREQTTLYWLDLAILASATPGCRVVAFYAGEPVIDCETNRAAHALEVLRREARNRLREMVPARIDAG